MFSFWGGKKKASSDEHLEAPIPPARPTRSEDDSWVVLGSQDARGRGGLYPAIPGPALPPARVPAPAPPHYLQGVPFSLSKELQMSSNKDAFATQIGDLLAFTARRLQLDQLSYDFSVERSVLQECQDAAA